MNPRPPCYGYLVRQASACLVLSCVMRESKPDRLKPVLLDYFWQVTMANARVRRLKNKFLVSLSLIGAFSTSSIPLSAHHGSTSFKTDHVVVLERATVTKFVWANPHTMLLFDVRDDKGGVAHWAGEAGSPAAVRQLG
jgi:hypothetical protein